jgi:hypothetical protein
MPPILLIIFNRPDLTARVFERIREQRPTQLFIAADGPRVNRPAEIKLCSETRDATKNIDWPCEVHRLDQSVNLGCKMGVFTAINWFFKHIEHGIILEDDCLPHATFFPYCAELLDRYRYEPKVAMIGSNQFCPKSEQSDYPYSYYFSKYPHIWGWATWRRVWQKYDINIKSWNGDPRSLSSISNPRVRKHFARRFDQVYSGIKDTWDFQLVHLCLSSGLLAINPIVNLVENIGFDERATHTKKIHPTQVTAKMQRMIFPLSHPTELKPEENFDLFTETRVCGVPPNCWVAFIWSVRKRMLQLTNLLIHDT